MLETAFGSASGEEDIAAPLSKAIKKTAYTLSFGGYNDPDKGLPSISRYDRGKSGLIWMADSYDDDAPRGKVKLVAGPKGVRCNDPFAFASALGLDLRAYYD